MKRRFLNIDYDKEVVDLINEVFRVGTWIATSAYSKVYFRNCCFCGKLFTSGNASRIYCSKEHQVNGSKIKSLRKRGGKPRSETKNNSLCKNVTINNGRFVVRKLEKGESLYLYAGYDYFEAVCAIKSYEAGNKEIKKMIHSASGVTGVTREEQKTKTITHEYWRACVMARGKRVPLYFGKDLFEAVCARKSWEAKNANKD